MNEKPKKIYTKKFKDKRGFFKEIFKAKNINKKFIFDCYSKSKKNVFRGLHLQLKKQQAKLITVTKGKIIDFALDVRRKSKNFGKIYKFKIDEDSNFSLYIPEGFAHGFLCLSKSCAVYYKCSNYRDAKSEVSINYKILKIKKNKLIISKKDILAPKLEDIKHRLK
jgi:dTDP-4-dehydrorhamnose 3,5-epimerase